MKTLCTLAVLFASTCFYYAQDASSDFKKINATYSGNDKVSMNIKYSVFETETANTPIQVELGCYKKNGRNYYNSLMGAETIVNGKDMLTINSSDERMILSPRRDLAGADMAGIKLDDLLKLYKSIEYMNVSKTTKGYTLYFKGDQGLINKCEIFYDAETYFMTRMVIFYKVKMDLKDQGQEKAKAPRLEIEFSDITTHPTFSENDFSLEKYLQPGTPQKPALKYENYKLIVSKS